MIEEVKLNELNQLVNRLSREELVWLNGYVSGILKSPLDESQSTKLIGKLTVAYGTETGNAKKLATEFATRARKQGVQVKLAALDQYRLADLTKEENFALIVSTHGEGEAPAAAKKFFNHLYEGRPDLSKLQYSVLALGDTAYPLFCKAGEDADAQLNVLGGKRIAPLQKCDVDFEQAANFWFDHLTGALTSQGGRSVSGLTAPIRQTGRKVYSGTILSKVNLNGKGSAKETYHIEIAAGDLVYEPGDAIGIVPKNKKEDVEKIIHLLGADLNQSIAYKGKEYHLSDVLVNKVSISYLPERVVNNYATLIGQNIPSVRLDLIDLLKIYPPRENQVEEIIQLLEPITPRLYSISSSLKAHEGEAHITVARNCFQLDGVTRHGLCSDYLAQLDENSTFEFYVHRNSQFKLPPPEKDIVMIGPGTGIAAFRAFVEERVNRGATGRSWLFFGDQHFGSDFLYQTEWQDYVKTGALTKMNVAFSRDQEEKIYVQHKLLENATEFFEWINNGAYLYVCGAKDMSIDVETILLEIISVDGERTEEQAQEYLNKLAEEGRYLKDVY